MSFGIGRSVYSCRPLIFPTKTINSCRAQVCQGVASRSCEIGGLVFCDVTTKKWLTFETVQNSRELLGTHAWQHSV